MATKRTIETNLMKKLETFRVLALGEATKLPILLIGQPGVAKTAAVIDFAKAATNGKIDDKDVFLLETDEGTRSNEIKGNIDLEQLTLHQKFVKNSPIVNAKYVIINEVDKASASLRNSMLGVMNERVLFNGVDKVPCDWEAFIATCNKIPQDEVDSPFWDRFLIKLEVNRMSQNDMLKYYAKGGKAHKQNHHIPMPEESDITGTTLNSDKVRKTMEALHKELSDRTLTYLPFLIKNIMVIWKFDEDSAMIKAAELLTDKQTARTLANQLLPKEVKDIYNAIDKIGEVTNTTDYDNAIDRVNDLVEKYATKLGGEDKLPESLIKSIETRAAEQEAKLVFEDEDTMQEVFDTLS